MDSKTARPAKQLEATNETAQCLSFCERLQDDNNSSAFDGDDISMKETKQESGCSVWGVGWGKCATGTLSDPAGEEVQN